MVIIPTYNEVENLPGIVNRLFKAVPDAHVLVADDNSPDGTGALADSMAAKDERIHVLHRAGKQGLGAAYLAGFAWGLERDYAVLVEMDADGSHQPEYLPTILGKLEDADVSLGSRWVAGGSVVNWPKSRELLSRGGNFYVNLMLRLGIKDATGGFRAYRATALKAMRLETVVSNGYCFQIDLVRRAHKSGLVIVESPIEFIERVNGVSKMSNAIVREALWRVTVWGIQSRLGLSK